MKATSSVLSARATDGAAVTSNCMPLPNSPAIKTPQQNGHATAKEQKKPVQKPSRHLNGRTSLQPSLLLKPTNPFPVQRIPRFSPPLSETLVVKNATTEIPPPATRVDRPLWAPVLATSHVMNDLNVLVDAVSDAIKDVHITDGLHDQAIKEATRQASSLLLADLIHVSVRYNLPYKWVARNLRRQRLRRKIQTKQTSKTIPRRRQKINSTLTRIHGIKNFGGQSCFLNSVLQALAALPSFLAYLERIVALQYERSVLDEALGKTATTTSLAECLLLHLSHLNAPQPDFRFEPGEILYRVGKVHAQFRPLHGRHLRSHVGTEQQDAQELLQALLGMVIADACLDNSTSSSLEERRQVRTPLDFSQQASQEGDSVLSLSGFLSRVDMEEEEKVENQQKIMASSSNGHGRVNGSLDDENGHLPREEKKQEDFELSPMRPPSDSQRKPLSTVKDNDDDESILTQLSASTLMMLSTLSPMTPSPLSGWIGSTLQCCTCHHVRPIQNAPFLDIPIVPTAVSRYLDSNGTMPTSAYPPCTLYQCLKDFCSVERVNDVECRSCTIRRDAAQLEEEIFMLRGAVETVLERCRKRGQSGEEQVVAMRNELEAAETRYARLVNTDPDDGELDGEKGGIEEDNLYLSDTSSPPCLIRGDARKWLLLTRMPSVLCLHVQRRYYDPVRDCMSKALQHIDFPQVLDLGPHCAYGGGAATGLTGKEARQAPKTPKPIPYKLMSVIEHRGNAHAGHYQTYRRAPKTAASSKEWVLVSDLNVTPLHWRDVKRCQAYMLFYEAM